MEDAATASGQHVRDAPFDLYGLSHEFVGPRVVAGFGKHGGTVNLVELGHGDQSEPPYRWVRVGVMGPLHGQRGPGPGNAGARWSIDPLPMIAAELLARAHPELRGSEVPAAANALMAQESSDLDLILDGRPVAFRVLSDGDHWAAMRDLEEHHMLFVISSLVPPAEVRLVTLEDVEAYIGGTPSTS